MASCLPSTGRDRDAAGRTLDINQPGARSTAGSSAAASGHQRREGRRHGGLGGALGHVTEVVARRA
jgi:hypothetical protein